MTGSDDRTLRIWSAVDGKLLQTIWIWLDPYSVGAVDAVAISPDGSTIAVGGWTENLHGNFRSMSSTASPGNLIRQFAPICRTSRVFLTFSPDGRYLAATLGRAIGLRVFDRDRDWSEAFRDEQYGDDSYGATFTRDGRLAATASDGLICLISMTQPTRTRTFAASACR